MGKARSERARSRYQAGQGWEGSGSLASPCLVAPWDDSQGTQQSQTGVNQLQEPPLPCLCHVAGLAQDTRGVALVLRAPAKPWPQQLK